MKKASLIMVFLICQALGFAQNWLPMAGGLLPNGHIIFSISAVDDQVVWAVSSEAIFQAPVPASHQIRVLRSADGGQTWVLHQVEEAAGTISFCIVAVDSLTAWITTQDYGTGPGRALYKTSDGGQTWIKKFSNAASGVSLHHFSNGQNWLAHNRQAKGTSSDNGDNWTTGTVSGYGSNEFQILYSGTNMTCSVGDTAWNGTSGGRIVRFTNFGESSTFINTNLGTSSTILSIAFHDARNGLLYYKNALGVPKIAQSTDGGSTWTILNTAPFGYWNLTAVPGASGYYVLASDFSVQSGKVAITKDFGQTWTVETLGHPLNAVTFTSPTTGWVSSGGIVSSSQPALYKYDGSPLVPVSKLHPAETIGVAPNPAGEWIRLDLPESFQQEVSRDLKATVFDAAGQVVFIGKILNNILNVNNLNAGLYFIKIEQEHHVGVAQFLKN